MNFHDTPEEAAFRTVVRDFIKSEAPPRMESAEGYGGAGEAWRSWMRKLAERRWIAPAWPKEYGGAGLSVMEQFIFNSEMAEARAPRAGGIATGFAGPTLIVHGTEEQKKKYLPEILSGDVSWCQGYSEPGAGSDLAAIQTRAVRDGDDYVVNGQKIWTSGGHNAKRMILLARTDPDAPKHRGITYFIVHMDTPGIQVRPLVNAAYTHEFNEVFFEDVRVPKENIIGEENRGWYLAQTTLSFERSNIGSAIGTRQNVEDLIKFAKEAGDHSTLSHNDSVKYELVERLVEAQVANVMSLKIISIQAKEGVAPGHEASVAKLYGTELNQRVYRTAMKMLGMHGQLDGRSPNGAPMRGRIKYMYIRSTANTIEGGTSEIQRNIIATRGLGLPRA